MFVGRNKKKLRTVPSFAVVVDGDTESWYFQMLQRNERHLNVRIKPELPSRKKLEDQFDLVIKLSKSEYDKVFWIIDHDTILKESNENSKNEVSPLHKIAQYKSMVAKEYPNVEIIINNPCLEYWFLLHFENTTRPFRNCSEVTDRLKVHITDYEKSRRYFTKDGRDIYLRLKPNLKSAIGNATTIGDFDPKEPKKSISELFHFFNLNEFGELFKSAK